MERRGHRTGTKAWRRGLVALLSAVVLGVFVGSSGAGAQVYLAQTQDYWQCNSMSPNSWCKSPYRAKRYLGGNSYGQSGYWVCMKFINSAGNVPDGKQFCNYGETHKTFQKLSDNQLTPLGCNCASGYRTIKSDAYKY